MVRCCGRSSSPAARSQACSGIRAKAMPWGAAGRSTPRSSPTSSRRSAPILGQPELPFYYVQIGRFVNGADPKGWNTVQDAQRSAGGPGSQHGRRSVIDLELDDGIHVGTQGLKRAGQRLARIAERELFGQVGATTPTFDRVLQGARTIRWPSSSKE